MSSNESETDDAPLWQVVVTMLVLVSMFGVLVTDRVATDCVMLTALTVFYMTRIITIQEALYGFSAQGLLTVLALFAVAEGLNKTGALNWYVGKLLGRPKTIAEAQLRVMVPIAAMSGFINDTPLVTVALPSIIQWSKKTQIPPRFLLIPLSFAALLGGVCTLIGTSTNLVITGLLQDTYPDRPELQTMSLFGIGQYGFPVSLCGIAYVIFATPWLMARGRHKYARQTEGDDMLFDVLLGAKLLQWSPAAGRTVQRSGLRDTGGIYLVRVKRASTGNVHHAVGPDFVLQAGDILYFTGLVESFGEFCSEHGLEVVTNEVQDDQERGGDHIQSASPVDTPSDNKFDPPGSSDTSTSVITYEDEFGNPIEIYEEDIGFTLESVLETDPRACMRIVYHMQDAIRGEAHAYQVVTGSEPGKQRRIVISYFGQDNALVVAIDTTDRNGLLLDVSKCLSRSFNLQHTEAAVLHGTRSVSIWRCKSTKSFAQEALTERKKILSELWSQLSSMLSEDSVAAKQRGLRVVRARVLQDGRLIGKTPAQTDFRSTYRAAIAAIMKRNSRHASIQGDNSGDGENLAEVALEVGDVLVVQVEDDSPLLVTPPDGYYENLVSQNKSSQKSSIFGFGRNKKEDEDEQPMETGVSREQVAVWKDLQVLTLKSEAVRGEFLVAMKVATGSPLSGDTAEKAGIDSLPEAILVSIERPVEILAKAGSGVTSYVAIALSEPMQDADVLWFSCRSASAVGDLRKIPGLISYQTEEVDKMNAKVYDRRLVQAVVARNGGLVGKTVKELRFRTKYGAAVISVQREGRRVHEHPGNVKLVAGDVLLLEAGPSFISENVQHDRSFALVAEVRDSAPPRMRMLIPALLITAGAYACFMAKFAQLFGCAMVAVILMVLLGILSQNEARAAIQWEIYLTIASAYGIGTALVKSGVAGQVGDFLVRIGNATGLGEAGLLGAVYLATVLISQIVANNAAAALIFPIAMSAAESSGTDLVLMSYNIMLAASAAFMTPFGYATNIMVMGPGGYSTIDYVIFGTPMQVLLLFCSTIFLVSPMWICWLAAFVAFIAVCGYRLWSDLRSVDRAKKF